MGDVKMEEQKNEPTSYNWKTTLNIGYCQYCRQHKIQGKAAIAEFKQAIEQELSLYN